MLGTRTLWVSASLALVVAACGGGGGGNGFNGSIAIDADRPDICDPLDPRQCLLPFPSDTFTEPDDRTDTGLHIRLPSEGTPTNKDGVQIDTTEWNRNDGFSPGSQILTHVPGIDLGSTGAAPITDIGASLAEDAPIVILDVEANERIPYWAELDATVASDANRVLFVRPARNLREGHRHVVALRRLRDANGAIIPAGDVFRAYRDRLRTDVEAIEARRDRYERVFADLAANGVDRDDDLYLAWDFTVASERNLSERVLKMRDDAFASLGDAAPGFTVTNVEENVDDRVARRISGTFQVPLYLTGAGEPGSRISYGADGLPARNGTYDAAFLCVVPRSAVAGPEGAAVPARPAVYGHGLLGSEREASAGNVRSMANEHNFVFCATKWIGLSEEDIGNAVGIPATSGAFRPSPTAASKGW